MTYKVYAPNVHLFAFHLRDDSQSNKEYDDKLLWNKCREIFKVFEISQDLKTRDVAAGSRINLLEETTNENLLLPLEGAIILDQTQKKRITGVVCSLQIYDSYALALNLRIDEFDKAQNKTDDKAQNRTEEVDIGIFSNFNPDNCLLSTNINSSLGQTLLLTAWLPKNQQQDSKLWRKISDECVQNFLGQKTEYPQLYQEGQLFGSPIFEYGIPDSPNAYEHIIVWLFLSKEDEQYSSANADENLTLFYQEFIDLFFSRNKVIKAYHFSRSAYTDTLNLYKEFKKTVDEIANLKSTNNTLTVSNKSSRLSDSELGNFQVKLSILPKQDFQYAEYLAELDKRRLNIDTNTKNYTEKLRQIQEKAPKDDLHFLSIFNQKISIKFSNQIQTDLGYFVHTSGLVNKVIASIRGIVEIEQAERDRQKQELAKRHNENLQTVIAVLGFGLGAAQVGVSTAPYVIPQQQPPIPIQLTFTTSQSAHPFVLSVGLSLLFGVTGAFVGWGLSHLLLCFESKHEKNSEP